MNRIRTKRESRRGLTLLELLVCTAIVLAVSAAVLPLLSSGAESRRLREAARAVHAYFDGARNQAAGSGRTMGVMIERFADAPAISMVLSMAEIPAPYTGDFADSRLWVAPNGLARFTSPDASWVGLLRPNDLVRLNYQGSMIRIGIGKVDSGGYLTADSQPWLLVSDSATIVSTPPAGLPFQIFRQPQKSAAAPLQLPESTVIDLSASGFQANEFLPQDGSPLVIMFSPGGAIDRVYYSGQNSRPTDRLHLLIGARSGAATGSGASGNWMDPKTLWVSVNPRFGQVTTTENSLIDPAITDPMYGLPLARRFAREAQAMGER